MLKRFAIGAFFIASFFIGGAVYPETAATVVQAKPFRTFITIKKYNLETTGSSQNIANISLAIIFPNGAKAELPETGRYWPVGIGQTQEINRTFEIPFEMVQKDGFHFTIQMYRQGAKILPCDFDVEQISQFNRSYVCHTDVNYQMNEKLSDSQIDKEGVEVRVFTDKNTSPKEIPQDAIALSR